MKRINRVEVDMELLKYEILSEFGWVYREYAHTNREERRVAKKACVCKYIRDKYPQLTLLEIANFVGLNHHTTVMHLITQFEQGVYEYILENKNYY